MRFVRSFAYIIHFISNKLLDTSACLRSVVSLGYELYNLDTVVPHN